MDFDVFFLRIAGRRGAEDEADVRVLLVVELFFFFIGWGGSLFSWCAGVDVWLLIVFLVGCSNGLREGRNQNIRWDVSGAF